MPGHRPLRSPECLSSCSWDLALACYWVFSCQKPTFLLQKKESPLGTGNECGCIHIGNGLQPLCLGDKSTSAGGSSLQHSTLVAGERQGDLRNAAAGSRAQRGM